jgi:hypothetical protein
MDVQSKSTLRSEIWQDLQNLNIYWTTDPAIERLRIYPKYIASLA